MSQPADTLTLKGFGKLDGNYSFNYSSLIDIGGKEALTSQEQHRIKLITNGIRGGEIAESAAMLDAATWVALLIVILARHGKNVTDERMWNTRIVYVGDGGEVDEDEYRDAVFVRLAARAVEGEEADGEAGPPAPTPTPDSPSQVGGTTLSLTSALRENGQSPTGVPDLERSATSDRVTSAI